MIRLIGCGTSPARPLSHKLMPRSAHDFAMESMWWAVPHRICGNSCQKLVLYLKQKFNHWRPRAKSDMTDALSSGDKALTSGSRYRTFAAMPISLVGWGMLQGLQCFCGQGNAMDSLAGPRGPPRTTIRKTKTCTQPPKNPAQTLQCPGPRKFPLLFRLKLSVRTEKKGNM